jgi:thymidylate synthase ThyX
MHTYFEEPFSPSEQDILRRYFTNVDRPVFALINLPEVVKGALFARYSRTHKSLRRLFLDEFYAQPGTGVQAIAEQLSPEQPDAASKRAEDLYEKVLAEYGDDSVAQLGGAHLACEQASNLLTKVLEWGRLAAYLEQSTRYIFYDRKLGGRYRYFVPPEIDAVPGLGALFRGEMDWLFSVYSQVVRELTGELEQQFPRAPGDPEQAWRAAIRAKACDAARGLLPAATTSNLGIYATGQSYEMLLMRMRGHPVAEAREYAGEMLGELRKVIPAFLKRVDLEDRGALWTRYMAESAAAAGEIAARLDVAAPEREEVRLVDWDPEAEVKLAAAALYAASDLPDDVLVEAARRMSASEREQVMSAYAGDRTNRRHRPGRAFERVAYRFDVVCDFGAFRDLQRHRMLTMEWQRLGTALGYRTPELIESTGRSAVWHEAMGRMRDLHARVSAACGRDVAQYAVPFAYRLRFYVQMNAREAMHMIELRTTRQGHPDYRRVCQEMHRLIRDQAGHRAIAASMKFVDYAEYDLERLEAEKRREEKLGVGKG